MVKNKTWIQILSDKAERPLIVILHVGILFKILALEWGHPIISVTTVILSVLYFFSVTLFLPHQDATAWSQTLYKSAYLGCGISLMGLFFKSHSIPGFKTLLVIGSAILILVFFNVLYQRFKNPQVSIFNRKAYIRNMAIIVVGIVYFFI